MVDLDGIHEFFATAPRGMEPLLAQEIESLHPQRVATGRAGVSFGATMQVAYRACLWSRIANRILFPLHRFAASDPDELYRGVQCIHWSQHLAADGSLAVDCHAAQSRIDHAHFAALKVKDAIVDQLRDQFGVRPTVELERPDVRINLHLYRDEACISLDLAGMSLHRRGYRKRGGEAPLKENLAAAILMRAGWPAIANKGAGFVDPMCGSGTICIEAAMMAADIAPGLGRDYFGFLGWKGFDPSLWEPLLDEANARRETGRKSMPPVTGFDVDSAAVRTARANAQEAGLGGRVQIVHAELDDVLPPEHGRQDVGLVVVNPPYGERIGQEQDIEPLYARLGKKLKAHFRNWEAAIFTGNPKLASALRFKPHRSYSLHNGPLKCRLLCFHIGSRATLGTEDGSSLKSGSSSTNGGDSVVTPRRYSVAEVKLSDGAQMLANRLRKKLRHVGRWARRNNITCYRLYDADLPEYALAVDVYQGERTWLHIQEYAPPSTVDERTALRRREEGLETAAAVMDVTFAHVFFKTRSRQRGRSQYERQKNTSRFYEVAEGQCRYWVNFADYLDTGLFLDQRLTRRLIQEQIQERPFLNLFGYTGASTVAAAVGGASSTTTVDLSRTYLNWAERNLALNGFIGSEHQLVNAACGDWLREQNKKRSPRYGLIWLDPPTFSNSKRTNVTFDVQRDHVELIHAATKLLLPDGLLLFSTNFRRFKLDRLALGNLVVEELSATTLPLDFERRRRQHNCWGITCLHS